MATVSSLAANAGFPSQDRTNKEKDKKYVLAWLQAIYAKHKNFPMYWGFPMNVDDNTGKVPTIWYNQGMVRETRLATRGLMDVEKYKRVFALNSPDANQILTGRAIQWKMPMDHLPYFKRLRNILTNRDTELDVKVLDPEANDKHLDELFGLLAAADLASNPEIVQAAAAQGVNIQPPANEPQTPTEWEMMQKMGTKPAMAMTIELAINAIKALVKYDRNIRPFIADALIDDNVLVLTSTLNNRGIPIPRQVRYENCIIPETSSNWQDMPWFGYRIWMTPSEIMAEMGEECTPEIRRRLEKMAMKSSQNTVVAGFGMQQGLINPNRTENGIQVFVGFFKDYNTFDVAQRKSDGIAKVYDEDSMDPSEYDIRRNQYEVVYQGCWIPDTFDSAGDGNVVPVDGSGEQGAISWGCRLAYNQVRMKNALWKTRLPVVCTAYEMTDMTCISIGMAMMAAYENVIRASLELKALILHIIPPMVTIEESWLDRVTSVSGAGQEKRSDIIKAALQSGVFVVNSRDPDDENDTGVRGLQVGIQLSDAFIPDFTRLTNLIQEEMARFERIAGFNEATNGGTIDERQAVRNVNMMAAAQSKVLKPITDCMDAAEGDLAEIMYGQLQCSLLKGNEISWLAPFLGESTAKLIHLTAETDPGSVGIEMKQRATEEERLRFEEMLDNAVAQDAITADDRMYISSIRNRKEAAEILKVRRESRERTKQENQMALVQEDGKKVQASMEGQAQLLQQRIQLESQAKMEQMGTKHQLDMEAKDIQHQLNMEEVTAKIQGAFNVKMEELRSQMAMLIDTLATKERIAHNADSTKIETTEMVTETQAEIADKTAKENPPTKN